MNCVEIKNFTKRYGSTVVFDSLELTIDQGSGVVGVVGDNGAGKSTLLRAIAQIDADYSGSCKLTIDGEQVVSKFDCGFLPEERSLPNTGSVERVIRLWAELRGFSHSRIKEVVDYWIGRMRLSEYRDSPVRNLSKGNQQKVQLACCLLHEPRVVIFDEPFSGLDPSNQELVVDLLTECSERGGLVLISAHQLELVERISDKLYIVRNGEVTEVSEHLARDADENIALVPDPAFVTSWEARSAIDDNGALKIDGLELEEKARLFDAIVSGHISVRNNEGESLRDYYMSKSYSGAES